MRSAIQLRFTPGLFLVFCFSVLCAQEPNAELVDPSIYGKIDPKDYLLGRFNPTKEDLFVDLSTLGIETKGRKQLLRKDTALALKRMLEEFNQQNPKTKIWVQSATRTFYDQKSIWENKWTGKTLVEGKSLNKTISNGERRAYKILEFSSMPGSSRHHWGTDFDINILTNSYYKAGEGKIIYEWMLKNAKSFGFCQPYTQGRQKGYLEERWHWSYKPVSKKLYEDWLNIFGESSLSGFEGSKDAGHLAPTYVESVGSDCL